MGPYGPGPGPLWALWARARTLTDGRADGRKYIIGNQYNIHKYIYIYICRSNIKIFVYLHMLVVIWRSLGQPHPPCVRLRRSADLAVCAQPYPLGSIFSYILRVVVHRMNGLVRGWRPCRPCTHRRRLGGEDREGRCRAACDEAGACGLSP
jgi:hypothetical protein